MNNNNGWTKVPAGAVLTYNGKGGYSWDNLEHGKCLYLIRHIDVDVIEDNTEIPANIDHIMIGWYNGLDRKSIFKYWATTNSSLHISYEDGKMYMLCNRKGREDILKSYKISSICDNSYADPHS